MKFSINYKCNKVESIPIKFEFSNNFWEIVRRFAQRGLPSYLVMGQLILLRHGQSTWNLEQKFTGWVDVELTPQGVDEAIEAGKMMLEEELFPDVVHTSLLRRAIRTSDIALDVMSRSWIPVHRHWRLNERHYGALQGKTREEVKKVYSSDQVRQWRRSYDVVPPGLERNEPSHPIFDTRYANIAKELLPDSECLKDVLQRMLPYYYDVMVPQLKAGLSLLVSAHGNSLRALVMHLENIERDEILTLEIPNGAPIVYDVNEELVASRTHWLRR